MDARLRIINATTAVLGSSGLNNCSVDGISSQARCAKGLINYHFRTKEALFAEVARSLRARRLATRLEALAAGGTEAVDRLWDLLVAEVRSGEAAAWLGLVASPATRPEACLAPQDVARLGQAAAGALELGENGLAMGQLAPALDGLQLSLLAGASRTETREAYDRLWLGLLSAVD